MSDKKHAALTPAEKAAAEDAIRSLYSNQVRALLRYAGAKVTTHTETRPRDAEVKMLLGALRTAREAVLLETE